MRLTATRLAVTKDHSRPTVKTRSRTWVIGKAIGRDRGVLEHLPVIRFADARENFRTRLRHEPHRSGGAGVSIKAIALLSAPVGSALMCQEAVDALCALLDLEAIEVNIFRGISPDEDRQRVFGGQVAGQALVAAARTVDDDRPVHSLHAYFLRPGDPTVPILYEVDRIRDGRSFTTRRVVAIQHGKAIFNLQASFHRPEDGLDHQVDLPTPCGTARCRPTRDAARLAHPDGAVRRALRRRTSTGPGPIDTRNVDWSLGPAARPAAPAPAGLAAGRRHPARRPGAARTASSPTRRT